MVFSGARVRTACAAPWACVAGATGTLRTIVVNSEGDCWLVGRQMASGSLAKQACRWLAINDPGGVVGLNSGMRRLVKYFSECDTLP